jgi:hypothetical protein
MSPHLMANKSKKFLNERSKQRSNKEICEKLNQREFIHYSANGAIKRLLKENKKATLWRVAFLFK